MTASACIRLLRDYVAIPSVNPMGRVDIPDEIAGETRIADHIRGQLRKIGVDAELVGEGARQSVVAEIRCADPKAETVLVYVYGKLRACVRGFSEGKSDASKQSN